MGKPDRYFMLDRSRLTRHRIDRSIDMRVRSRDLHHVTDLRVERLLTHARTDVDRYEKAEKTGVFISWLEFAIKLASAG